MERLDKTIAEFTEYSRKDVRRLVREKRVTIDGRDAVSFDQKVDDDCTILIDGEKIARYRRIVAMLNKPKGYVTSTEDPRDPTVMEIVPKEWRLLAAYPVGRLDKDTEGLLVFTNDGALAHRLISPKSGIEKEYVALHSGRAGIEDVEAFAKGIVMDGEVLRPAVLIPMEEGKSRVIVTEGKYHQVRRMMASRGLDVRELKRIREGNLLLGELKTGQWRELEESEEKLLFKK